MASQIAKYDLFTDIDFISQTYYCPNLNSTDLSYMCFFVILINLGFTFYNFITTLKSFMSGINKKKKFDNSTFINHITKLSFLLENHSFGTILDRFSTSSTVTFK